MSGELVTLRPGLEPCYGGEPECGPAVVFDVNDLPLCQRCADAIERDMRAAGVWADNNEESRP